MTIEWAVPRGQARPLTDALHSLIMDVQAARGCLGCSISADIRSRGIVRYTEEWQSEEDLRGRLGPGRFTSLATLMEGAIEPPWIEFSLPRGTRGLDFVEEAQQSKR